MKLLPLTIAALGLTAAFYPSQRTQQILIITGDADGNLAPCGCTKPMTGGIKRRIQAAKELSIPGHTTFLDNGNLVAGIGRQDQIKAQTAAEILGAAGWDAINVGPADAKLGLGMLLSMNSLAQGKFIASQLQPGGMSDIRRFSVSPPFLIIGVAAQPEQVGPPIGQMLISADDAIKEGMEQAKGGQLLPIVLLQGTREEALQLASKYPDLKLIAYRSGGSPPAQMERSGNTVLVSPGSDGKYLIRMEVNTGNFGGYQAVALGPQYKDDPTASRLYRNYLNRVSSEKLLEKLPRMSTVSFSGSNKCGTCHQKALSTWKHSLHSHSLPTLAKFGHDRDPECLPCHVVALTSTKGFQSPKLTPDLAAVGCESCHGSGSAHSASPKTVRLPKVTGTTCATCHTANTSPNFAFASFWKKIKH